jgi:anti-anti-sigma factor
LILLPVSAVSEQRRFVLHKPVVAESLAELRAGIAQAVAAGIREIVIDIDDVAVLDSPILAALVSMLSESRKGGAAVTLRATRKSILDTLRITALTKVFTIVSEDAAPALPAPPARVGGMPKARLR